MATIRPVNTSVLVVGGGPVGLVLAMSLAQRGIDVVVAESRRRGESPSAKCNHVSARSMEIFRQLGIAAEVRDCGLPAEYSNDVAYRTTTTGAELARIHIPCRRDRYTDASGPDGWWPTPEPPHRANQLFLEPVLMQCAVRLGVRIVAGLEVLSFSQGEHGVTAMARDLATGDLLHMACEYLIGCDGGKSSVRKQIGASLVGTDLIGRTQSTHIRAPGLLALLKHAPAWATFSLNERRCGNVYAIDGVEQWLVHNYLRPDETDFDAVDRDRALRQILGVDADFRYEVIGKEDWIARRLVADRFRDRRVFICGDAAHIWVPMAGYGMNAGIADAANLGWLLAAHLSGWASAAILDAYERERRPITEQVSRFAMDHALALQRQRQSVPCDIEATGPRGDAARRAAGRALYELNVQQYCCAGLNFGYFYDDSPIIAYDDVRAPGYTMADYTPSTVPGCRMPHLWLRDGRSLYDAAGPDHALLRFDPHADAGPLLDAARRRKMPLRLIEVDAAEAPGTFEHALVLCRPDRHVAWRGGCAPGDALPLIDHLRGAAASPCIGPAGPPSH